MNVKSFSFRLYKSAGSTWNGTDCLKWKRDEPPKCDSSLFVMQLRKHNCGYIALKNS